MIKDFLNKEGEDYVKKGIVLDRLTEPKDISPIVVFALKSGATLLIFNVILLLYN